MQLQDRARVVAALVCVAWVTWFDEATPAELPAALRPDVYVKGGGYRAEQLPEARLGRARGHRAVRGRPLQHTADAQAAGGRGINAAAQVSALKSAPPSVLVVVGGDCMLDVYLEGAVQRISPEAPMPILQLHRQPQRAGGAANMALNLVRLRCLCTLSAVGAVRGSFLK